MKKAAVISLLVVFLFNSMGYYIVFKAEQWQIKSEVRSQIRSGFENDSQLKITISRAEFSSIELNDNGQEINYKGHLYDIARISETANTITYYCINDSKEESLFATLDQHINSNVAANKPVKNNDTKKITDNVVKVYFSPKNSFDFNSFGTGGIDFPKVNTFYISAQKQNSTPPPPEFC